MTATAPNRDFWLRNIANLADAEPELRIAAAVVANALRDAIGDDTDWEEALEFLATDRCLGWLSAFAPLDIDLDFIQAQLLSRVHAERDRMGRPYRQGVLRSLADMSYGDTA